MVDITKREKADWMMHAEQGRWAMRQLCLLADEHPQQSERETTAN